MKRNEDILRDLWDNIKRTNIRIIKVPEKEEKKKKKYFQKKIFEEMIVENFPNMGKEIVNQVLEAQRVPYMINPRRNTPRHILIELSKIKYKSKHQLQTSLSCCFFFSFPFLFFHLGYLAKY